MREKKNIIKLAVSVFTCLFVLNTFVLKPDLSFYNTKTTTKTNSNDIHVERSVSTEIPWKIPKVKTELTRSSTVRIEKKKPKSSNSTIDFKNIVFWTEYFGNRDSWYKVFKRLVLNECEENRCNLIIDKSKIDKAHAVIFNGNDLQKKSYGFFDKKYEHPKYKRREDQIYVFFSMEAPPALHYIDFDAFGNYFNWTMNYRRDSDIVIPYGLVTKRKKKKPKSKIGYVTDEELRNKSMAVWMVSHCPVQSKRELFVKELRHYITIDTYGKCGSKKCGDRRTITRTNDFEDDPCLELIKNYTFYMALENSLCEDYVTEKLYRSLRLGIVPIVLGAVNYSEFAPPNSYIDAKEFTTFSDLANHIKKVASEAKLYNEYLQWREDYDIELGSPYKPLICDLCKKLHEQTPKSPRKSYKNIRDWFFRKGTCFKLSDV